MSSTKPRIWAPASRPAGSGMRIENGNKAQSAKAVTFADGTSAAKPVKLEALQTKQIINTPVPLVPHNIRLAAPVATTNNKSILSITTPATRVPITRVAPVASMPTASSSPTYIVRSGVHKVGQRPQVTRVPHHKLH